MKKNNITYKPVFNGDEGEELLLNEDIDNETDLDLEVLCKTVL